MSCPFLEKPEALNLKAVSRKKLITNQSPAIEAKL